MQEPLRGGAQSFFLYLQKKTFGAPMGTPVMGALWALWASILGTLRAYFGTATRFHFGTATRFHFGSTTRYHNGHVDFKL